MADQDGNPDAIIGRDADRTAKDTAQIPDRADGDDIAEQLSETSSESAGGNVSGTAANDTGGNLDIVFEHEGDEDTRH